MVKQFALFGLSLLMIFSGCFKTEPTRFDSALSVQLYVKFEDSFLAHVPVSLSTYDYHISRFSDTTDTNGMVLFENVPWAQYQINLRSKILVPDPGNPDSLISITVIGTGAVIPGDEEIVVDTISVISSGAQPGLKINEIYTVGPPNNFFYFYDQFFELYNSSQDTIFLDGMIFCRMGAFLANVTYIFQFPGEPLVGREYPIAPGEFKVLAQDAFSHKDVVFQGQASIDLSHADFEFVNSLDFGDYDNPDVPNLDNLEVGHRLDFMVGLTGDVLLIADGSDLNYLDGVDINSVIDCVEYSASSTHRKEIESELDRSFAGVGQIKYSGSSLERINAGFDSNNSAVDFEIIPAPTPGWQHTASGK
jgi:hypothetical protein